MPERQRSGRISSVVFLIAMHVTGLYAQQPGLRQCNRPVLPGADSAVSGLFSSAESRLFSRVPVEPWQVDSVLYSAVRDQPHPPDLVAVLESAVAKYGREMVGQSLLYNLAHNGFVSMTYSIKAKDRGRAAAAYGLLDRLYPDSTAPLVLAGLLLNSSYPDELREGLATGAMYVGQEIRELDAALANVLCQSLFHLRPFVEQSSDIDFFQRGDRLDWYYSAMRLLDAVVHTLAVRPNGRVLLMESLSEEPNEVLAGEVRRWVSEAREPE